MLSFKQFLEETALKGGMYADDHAQKYLDSTEGKVGIHKLEKKFKGHPAGTSMVYHGYDPVTKTARMSTDGNESNAFHVPLSKIRKPVTYTGYNEEHAFKNVWNHGIDKGFHNLHDEIEKAKTDPKHPLHFDNADKKGFEGKEKTEEHREDYYNQLHHAANTISAIKDHKDLKKLIQKKRKASLAKFQSPTAEWGGTLTKAGGRKKTAPKTDIHIGGVRVSYKKGGGSQLMSAEPNEFMKTYSTSARSAINHGHMSEDDYHDVNRRTQEISKHLDSMKGKSEEDQEKIRHHAQGLLDDLHKKHPHLLKHVYHEAATGKEKFGEHSAGRASYLISSSHADAVPRVHDLRNRDNIHQLNLKPPRIATNKGYKRPGNVKIDL